MVLVEVVNGESMIEEIESYGRGVSTFQIFPLGNKHRVVSVHPEYQTSSSARLNACHLGDAEPISRCKRDLAISGLFE